VSKFPPHPHCEVFVTIGILAVRRLFLVVETGPAADRPPIPPRFLLLPLSDLKFPPPPRELPLDSFPLEVFVFVPTRNPVRK